MFSIETNFWFLFFSLVFEKDFEIDFRFLIFTLSSSEVMALFVKINCSKDFPPLELIVLKILLRSMSVSPLHVIWESFALQTQGLIDDGSGHFVWQNILSVNKINRIWVEMSRPLVRGTGFQWSNDN